MDIDAADRAWAVAAAEKPREYWDEDEYEYTAEDIRLWAECEAHHKAEYEKELEISWLGEGKGGKGGKAKGRGQGAGKTGKGAGTSSFRDHVPLVQQGWPFQALLARSSPSTSPTGTPRGRRKATTRLLCLGLADRRRFVGWIPRPS